MLDWEKTQVRALSREELEDGLADPDLGDAAEWIFKLCMLVIAAVRLEKASLEAEFSPVAAALAVGGETERKFGHAFGLFVRIVLAYSPGKVPYLWRVDRMRSAFASLWHELVAYNRVSAYHDARDAVESFLHAIFQRRYDRSATDWSAEVNELKNAVLAAFRKLAADCSRHYDTRKNDVRPPRPGKGVSRFAGQSIRRIVIPGGIPQTYQVNGVEYRISGVRAIAVVDALLAAYELHEGEFITMPRHWQNLFKSGGAPSFRKLIELEVVNNRSTGRARLRID